MWPLQTPIRVKAFFCSSVIFTRKVLLEQERGCFYFFFLIYIWGGKAIMDKFQGVTHVSEWFL